MIDKQKMRILRFLAAGGAALSAVADKEKALLDGGDRGSVAVARPTLRELAREGLVAVAGGRVALTDEGRAFRKRLAAGADGFLAQHRTLELQAFETETGREQLNVNLD